MSTMTELIGSQLEAYKIEVEDTGFQFSVGSLSIYNPIEIFGDLKLLVGSKVVSVKFVQKENLEIELNNGSRLKVSLKQNDYAGPEAFCMRFKSGFIVVE